MSVNFQSKPVPPETGAASLGLIGARSGIAGPNDTSKSCSEPYLATRQQNVKWGIHWQEPVLMVAFALCGTALAVGNHVYYKSLDGNVASTTETQQWPIRIGAAFAFLAMSLLKRAITTACIQITWAILRHRSISIKAIDKLFSITSDLTSIWSFELVKQAKVVLVLAILSWYVCGFYTYHKSLNTVYACQGRKRHCKSLDELRHHLYHAMLQYINRSMTASSLVFRCDILRL